MKHKLCLKKKRKKKRLKKGRLTFFEQELRVQTEMKVHQVLLSHAWGSPEADLGQITLERKQKRWWKA